MVKYITSSAKGFLERVGYIKELSPLSHNTESSYDLTINNEKNKLHKTLFLVNRKLRSGVRKIARMIINSLKKSVRFPIRTSRKLTRTMMKTYRKTIKQAKKLLRIINRRATKKIIDFRLQKEDLINNDNNKLNSIKATGNKVLYLVHMSLPYDSAGYATRTHSLLSNLESESYDAYTRLGYPFDINKSLKHYNTIHQVEENIIEKVNYENVVYNKILDNNNDQRTLNKIQYIRSYADNIVELLKSGSYKVIHASSDYRNGVPAAIASKRTGIPMIYEVRGLWHVTKASKDESFKQTAEFKIADKLELDTCKQANHVIALTLGLKNWLIERGIDESKISVLPNGISFQRFDNNKPVVSRSSTVPTIGYIGSFAKYEGLLQLVDVAKKLSSKGLNFKFLLVGDGEDYQPLKAVIDENNLSHYFELPGRVDFVEVEKYYNMIDICVFPRLPMEVCELVSPLKPFEAMYLKKAIIASDVAAQKEFIVNGHNGLLHCKGNIDSLTEQLESLISNPSLCHQLGDNAHKWVKDNRQWEKIISTLSNIYNKF